MTNALILDTESTGLNEPRIVEAAYVLAGSPLELLQEIRGGMTFNQRYNPGKPIELGALATHHIMDEDLLTAPSYTEFALQPETDIIIGHNVDYDWEVIGKPDVRRICTLALCRKLWPDADSHKLGAMLYKIDRQAAREMLRGAHSALADVIVCRRVLAGALHELGSPRTWDEVWKLSEIARVPTVMAFGKWKGTPIREVPNDYKQWLLRQPDVDPYLATALRGDRR